MQLQPTDLPDNIPIFYLQILFAWFLLKKEPQNPLSIRREYIILNQHISIDNKYIYEPTLIRNNLFLINDYFDEHGKAWNFKTFSEKNGNTITCFKYMSLIDAIPYKWRKIMKTQRIDINICNAKEPPSR